MGRAPCCDKASVKKGPWSPEEDAKLKAYIEQHGTGGNWIALPQKIGLKRCGKSCRLRWLNYLRPNIKHGGFSEEEDNIICSLYISIGSRWSIIAAQLPGRTDNDIKNYWNTRLKKKLLGRRKDTHLRRLSGRSSGGSENSSGFSSSALERLQLHMQLQRFPNPFSFYTHPALWPKVQEFGDGSSPLPHQGSATQPQASPEEDLSGVFMANSAASQQPCSSDAKQEFCFDGMFESLDGLQYELNDLISCNPSGLRGEEDQSYVPVKEMEAPKDSSLFWANGFDAQSSSSCWDSASVLQQEGMLPEFLEGYGL